MSTSVPQNYRIKTLYHTTINTTCKRTRETKKHKHIAPATSHGQLCKRVRIQWMKSFCSSSLIEAQQRMQNHLQVITRYLPTEIPKN